MILAAAANISMTVTPHVCFAPCEVRVSIRVTPHEDNRSYVVEVEADGYYSLSETPINGQYAYARQAPITLKDLPPGWYTIIASVRGTSNVLRGHTSTTLEVK